MLCIYVLILISKFALLDSFGQRYYLYLVPR